MSSIHMYMYLYKQAACCKSRGEGGEMMSEFQGGGGRGIKQFENLRGML